MGQSGSGGAAKRRNRRRRCPVARGERRRRLDGAALLSRGAPRGAEPEPRGAPCKPRAPGRNGSAGCRLCRGALRGKRDPVFSGGGRCAQRGCDRAPIYRGHRAGTPLCGARRDGGALGQRPRTLGQDCDRAHGRGCGGDRALTAGSRERLERRRRDSCETGAHCAPAARGLQAGDRGLSRAASSAACGGREQCDRALCEKPPAERDSAAPLRGNQPGGSVPPGTRGTVFSRGRRLFRGAVARKGGQTHPSGKGRREL